MSTRPLPRRIRITGDGDVMGTRVHDADTGEDLSNLIWSVYWQHVAGQAPRAVVTFAAAALDVVAAVECRHCGRLQTDEEVRDGV